MPREFSDSRAVPNEYHCDQHKNFQYHTLRSPKCSGMMGFKKCQESHLQNEPSQDSLSLIWGESQIVAVLCDGVSQSFYGNLAAYEVSTQLSRYLWDNRNRCVSAHEVTMFLNSLQKEIATLVQRQQLPENLPPIVRNVLEKRREYGSETVLAACVIETQRSFADVYVLGNIRVTWRGKGDTSRTRVLPDRERWSSKHGCKGIPEVRYWHIQPFISLSLLSDGLAEVFPSGIWNASKFKSLCQIEQSSHDDDIAVAYFERKLTFLEKHLHRNY